ncbi:MAG: hypothetical protein Ct9H300mP16_00540 [Pseudomonadota bacterium]|nr:MAG: hypothetical protein Ct9H300mP16_00540 [Pseudomonadota bacterium]
MFGQQARLCARNWQQENSLQPPGVFDLISARIAAPLGFPALYMTGYGLSPPPFGLPDAGLPGYSDMVEGVWAGIASATGTPLIAGAGTGYGGLLNVDHTGAGVSNRPGQGIQLEDQLSPKKCGPYTRSPGDTL